MDSQISQEARPATAFVSPIYPKPLVSLLSTPYHYLIASSHARRSKGKAYREEKVFSIKENQTRKNDEADEGDGSLDCEVSATSEDISTVHEIF